MQSYSLATLGLMVTTLFVAMYVFQGTNGDHIVRVALITNAKPELSVTTAGYNRPTSTILETAETSTTPEVVIVRGLPFNNTPAILADVVASGESGLDAAVFAPNHIQTAELTLPTEYNKYEPTVQLSDNTSLGKLSFSTEVNDNLQAMTPRRLFNQGRFKMYATFEYDGMADGMVWSWVWRHEGEVINGGHEVWAYGDEGPGYVYLNPATGFQSGQYSVEIWVNGKLLTQSNFFVTTDVAAQ